VLFELEDDVALIIVSEVAIGKKLHFPRRLVLPLDGDLGLLGASHEDVVLLALEVEGQDGIALAVGVRGGLEAAEDPPGDLLVGRIHHASPLRCWFGELLIECSAATTRHNQARSIGRHIFSINGSLAASFASRNSVLFCCPFLPWITP
jgi:hypothetical protein